MSLNAAALHFGLPEATVRRYKKKISSDTPIASHGGIPSLPDNLQLELENIARLASTHGFGLTKEEFRLFIASYVKINWDANNDLGIYLRAHCRFNDGVPSLEWMTHFMRKYHLSLKIPSVLGRCRSEAASDPFIINEFYDLLEKEIQRLQLSDYPDKVWNLDETSFCIDPQGGKIVAPIGSKAHRIISGSGRSCFTAFACVNAAGSVYSLNKSNRDHYLSLWMVIVHILVWMSSKKQQTMIFL